ncbi:hypothetical protein [Rhizobium glycinendophyticum]|uniref:Uncharacterized protein n=1 Tax=Rhizobium glycinendophyticum TaxID=2589807 RepID=A0A504UH05_9HYPH|nr:hypothetical protein [Rhizobium glycinendophyticum]TPP04283.1 hypothetical protein FJQ55_22515 [Rhizobium glycinendophyticum]
MFDLAKALATLPRSNQPIRIAARQFRWFKEAFYQYTEIFSELRGVQFLIDDEKLAACFLRWLDAISVQRPGDKAEREDFIKFAPSLMLNEFIADIPIKATNHSYLNDDSSVEAFWPEGYVVTTFCLVVYAATMEQEFHSEVQVNATLDDLRSWWSFKENAHQETAYAAGFFQLLLGQEPNWWSPANFKVRNKGAA